MPVLT